MVEIPIKPGLPVYQNIRISSNGGSKMCVEGNIQGKMRVHTGRQHTYCKICVLLGANIHIKNYEYILGANIPVTKYVYY